MKIKKIQGSSAPPQTTLFSSYKTRIIATLFAISIFLCFGILGMQLADRNQRNANAVPSSGTQNPQLPPALGGTGAATLPDTRDALGLGNTTGPVPIENGGTGNTQNLETIPVNGTVEVYTTENPNELGYDGTFEFVNAKKLVPTYANDLTLATEKAASKLFTIIDAKYEIQSGKAAVTVVFKITNPDVRSYTWVSGDGPNNGWFYFNNSELSSMSATTATADVVNITDGTDFPATVQLYSVDKRLIIKVDAAQSGISAGIQNFLFYNKVYAFSFTQSGFVNNNFKYIVSKTPTDSYINIWRRTA
jgi:hypothetical protein